MTNEYLNNRVFENIIMEFQKIKQERKMYKVLVSDIENTEKRIVKSKKYKRPVLWESTHKKFNLIQSDYEQAQEKLAYAFYTLSENIVRYAKFHLIDPDDAVQEGVMICFEKIDRFDPEKGKAFNYMTTCILNHFRQLYRTARNYNEFKRKYQDHIMKDFETELSKNSVFYRRKIDPTHKF